MTEQIKGKVRELIIDKLIREDLFTQEYLDTADIEWDTETIYEGYCETCAYEWDKFSILVDGVEVWNSSKYDYESSFQLLMEYLEE